MTVHTIQASKISYSFGKRKVIDSVSFKAGAGELLGLVGPNGSGKTTLLKLLDGMIKPDTGIVTTDGFCVSNLSSKKRARIISFMLQEESQSMDIGLVDFVLMGRYPYKRQLEYFNREDVEIAKRSIEYVGLSDFEERSYNTLSTGERQLAVLARILTQETSIILLDEPTSSLDIKHQDEIFSILYELSNEGKIVVVAVHNLNIAARYCSRLILLSEGKLIADGDVDEVLNPYYLDTVYGVKTTVSVNSSTGYLSIDVVPDYKRRFRLNSGGIKQRIHLIGGGGSAVNLTRELIRRGYLVTGGIAHEGDTDLMLWKSLNIECYSVMAFSKINENDIGRARKLVEAADLTVVCSFPVGEGNLGNLKLAEYAKKLIIIEDSKDSGYRKFYTESARELFERLKHNPKSVRVKNYKKLMKNLQDVIG